MCYYGHNGTINYGNNGKYKSEQIGVALKGGAELRVKVKLNKGKATFTTAGQQFRVHSNILCQSHREFVPYFEMYHKGDSVKWRIEWLT